jgi:hypothetical protein
MISPPMPPFAPANPTPNVAAANPNPSRAPHVAPKNISKMVRGRVLPRFSAPDSNLGEVLGHIGWGA